MDQLGQNGVLQVIPPAVLEAQLAQQAKDKVQAAQPAQPTYPQLIGYIKTQFEIFRNHRNTSSGWSERLLSALRAFNGQYDASKLQDIAKFGGSQIYARIIGQKCRAASSLLRDIYLSADRPWAIKPPADPDPPEEVLKKINDLLMSESSLVNQSLGQAPPTQDVENRRMALMDSARDAAKKKASKQARVSEDKVEEILRDGGFYDALAEFLVDLPIFPFACIKGPVVKVIPRVRWRNGRPDIEQTPTLTWNRVSPFDLWFTPGVSDIESANTIEKLRIPRSDLNDLLDLPGYNHDEIRAVLDEYGRGGLYDNWDTTDSERAALESRENPAWNRSNLLSMMEFNGNVQGRILQEYGMPVADELRDYHIQAWCIGSHIIKAQQTPNPRQRHPYFITSFEKVPGTPVGNGLTDLLADMQEAANATLRSLVNNISISSGPQVVINDDRLSPEENGEDLYPWKRWHVRNDPTANNSQVPISFFMPTANAQQLIAVYQEFVSIADDVSAIPKYVGGSGGGGAGRTASGLAMLMGNASKILQTVSANIDRDVIQQCLQQLTDLILLTDTSGLLNGEEKVVVQGVNVAIQRETLRQRQIEFLQATNNPTDMKIVGLRGRAEVLRGVAIGVAIDGDNIVPNEAEIERMEKREQDPQAKMAGALEEMVQKGVQQGVEQGVKLISKELTAGVLAARAHMPEGMGTHIGTLPDGGGAAPGPATNNPEMDLGEAARVSSGTRPQKLAGHGMAPQTSLVGNQPGKGALPLSPGIG